MNLKDLLKPFKEDEIEWRISQAGKKGNGQVWATCLAYVQARAIMTRLDEVCGPEGWRVEYSFIPGSQGIEPGVVCKLSIKCGDEWVTKEDGAEQTDIESFKGGISGALKRAAVAWGIGRYLYNLETGFAKIVEPGADGARYAKSTDKYTKAAFEFHWTPPNLPQWALPEGEKAKSNGIHPPQPGPGDGIQKPGTGTYIKYGRFAGQWLNQIDPFALRDWILEEENKAKKNGKNLTPWMQKIIAEAEPLIAAHELEATSA